MSRKPRVRFLDIISGAPDQDLGAIIIAMDECFKLGQNNSGGRLASEGTQLQHVFISSKMPIGC
jgi:hypothetical protein